jgi:hypothetical protein
MQIGISGRRKANLRLFFWEINRHFWCVFAPFFGGKKIPVKVGFRSFSLLIPFILFGLSDKGL